MSEKTIQCPFLKHGSTNQRNSEDNLDMFIHESPILGRYRLTEDAKDWLETHTSQIDELNPTQGLVNCAHQALKDKDLSVYPIFVMSHEFEKLNSVNELIPGKTTHVINIEELFKERVDHTEKGVNLLRIFSEEVDHLHAFSFFEANVIHFVRAKIAGLAEMHAVMSYLIKEGLLEGETAFLSKVFTEKLRSPAGYAFRIPMKGWEKIKTEKDKTNTNKVFIATAFGWPEDDSTRVKVLQAIKAACGRLGWEADIVSQNHTGNITDKILSEIRSSMFVIAELTYHNRGVYFESGFARGLGKDVFHLVRKGFTETNPDADKDSRRIHFDIQQVLYREWSKPEEVEELLYDWVNSLHGEYKP